MLDLHFVLLGELVAVIMVSPIIIVSHQSPLFQEPNFGSIGKQQHVMVHIKEVLLK